MTYNPSCPQCDIELELDDHYDMYDEGDVIICRAVGHCTKCGKHFRWEEVYSFSEIQDLEEDE